jgi:hypothetical protein
MDARPPLATVQALRGAGVAAIWLPYNRFAPRTFPLDALAGHTDLRELDLSQLKLSGKWAPLWQLTQLQHLQLHSPRPASSSTAATSRAWQGCSPWT